MKLPKKWSNRLWFASAVCSAIAMVFFMFAAWISDPSATSCENSGGAFACCAFVFLMLGVFTRMDEDL